MKNTSRVTFWHDEQRHCYIYLPDMTKAEWKQFSRHARRSALNADFVEYGYTDNPGFITSFNYGSGTRIICGKLFLEKYQVYIRSCRILYQSYKKKGNIELAREQLADAHNWIKKHNGYAGLIDKKA